MNEYIVEKKQTSGGWTWAEPKGKLIRCKDCANFNGRGKYCYCAIMTFENGFCSWAVRKEDDELRDMERKEE